MIYKIIKANHGSRYMKNGKFTSKDSIPPEILSQLEENDVVETKDAYCVFCGEPAKLQRLVDAELVWLCNEDYYGKTLGQIVEKLATVQSA